jgi:hypothetical protein
MRFSNERSRARKRHLADVGTPAEGARMTAYRLFRVQRSDAGACTAASPDRIAPAFTRRTRRDSLDTGKRFHRIVGANAVAIVDCALAADARGVLSSINLEHGAGGGQVSMSFAAATRPQSFREDVRKEQSVTSTWKYDRAKEAIDKRIEEVETVEIVDYKRDMSLESIPTNKAYRVDGVHMYADIKNLHDILATTDTEGERCHKRAALPQSAPARRPSGARPVRRPARRFS